MSGSILLTGATGFIGKALLPALAAQSEVIATTRNGSPVNSATRTVKLDMDAELPPSFNLSGVQTIVHQAALAHEPGRADEDFDRINKRATLALAQLAAQAGVKRFVYLSTIGVNGTQSVVPFTAADTPAPCDAYSRSKLEAEQGLQQIAQSSGMEIVIIRPPLVYGAGCRGNFAKLQSVALRNLPLPLGAIHNQRSFVGIDNLVDLIVRCTTAPAAANQVFLASDGHDVSTTHLLKTMIRAAGKRPLLLPVPAALLRAAASALGKGAAVDKLCGNLQVDITHTKNTLGWNPPVSFDEGIRRCFIR